MLLIIHGLAMSQVTASRGLARLQYTTEYWSFCSQQRCSRGRNMIITLEEERKKVVEAINATFSHLGAGISDLLTDRAKLGAAVAGATLLALGVYSTREGVRVAGRTFDRWFGTPRLVRAPCIAWVHDRSAPQSLREPESK